MKIAIVSIYPFPFGFASTNRIVAYSKGLKSAGNDVTVVMPFPSEAHNSMIDMPDKGIWEGINYCCLSGRRRNPSKIVRFLAMKLGIRHMLGIKRFKNWLGQNPQDAVIIYNDEPAELRDYAEIVKGTGTKLLFNFDEYPVPIREQGATHLPEWKNEAFKNVLPKYDGYISINKPLAMFYNAIVRKPTIELSMIVDIDRFNRTRGERLEWMTYMGQILWDKDNVLNIIDAFNLIRDEYPGLTFHIFGKGDANSLAMIRDRIKGYGLGERVIIEGLIKSESVAETMMRSKVLVSSQPDNKRVEGVLSTKLAEYVASGTPTVMCDVGVNRDYLSDKDCFFVKPDDSGAYADTLRRILEDYPSALSTAAHGATTIREKYSAESQGKRLSDFINQCL